MKRNTTNHQINFINNYQFYDFTEDKLPFKVVFVVGPSRSGKSSFSRLLESLDHVFHMEENWLLLMAPVMVNKGLMKPDVFVNLYRAAITESVYDLLLMRSASFRPTDDSFIRATKSQAAVDFSLNQLQSREDVDTYMKSNAVTVVINLAEMNAFIDLLEKVFPSARVFHMVRHPRAVMREIEAKHWHADQNLKKPSNGELFRKMNYRDQSFYIPTWVKERDSVAFIEMSLAERASYYAFRQYFLTAEAMVRAQKPKVNFVFYEDLVKSPLAELGRVFPGVELGEKTRDLISNLERRKDEVAERQSEPVHDTSRDWDQICKIIPGFREKYLGTLSQK